MSGPGQYRGGKLQGCCPMGCGETLERTAGGQIRCMNSLCGNPAAAHLLLSDGEAEHIVTVVDHGSKGGVSFTLRHPLRERLNGALEDCRLHAFLARQLHTGALKSRASTDGLRWRITQDKLRPPGARSYSWEPVHVPTQGEVDGGG